MILIWLFLSLARSNLCSCFSLSHPCKVPKCFSSSLHGLSNRNAALACGCRSGPSTSTLGLSSPSVLQPTCHSFFWDFNTYARWVNNPSALILAFRRPQNTLQNGPSSLEIWPQTCPKTCQNGPGAPQANVGMFLDTFGARFRR